MDIVFTKGEMNMLEVELKSNELKEYVYLELNKNKKDPIYDDDLNEITSLYLNKLDLIGEPTDITIYDLIFFKNLKECTISNMNISDQELGVLNRLSNLESLQLNDCNFSTKIKVELNIKNLIINKCENVNMSLYEDVNTLKRLQISKTVSPRSSMLITSSLFASRKDCFAADPFGRPNGPPALFL